MLHFIHISDTHIGSTENFALYDRNPFADAKALVQYLNQALTAAPAFILHTGDVTNNYDDAAARLAADIFADLKYPIYYVAGNHDSPATLREFLLKQPRSDAPLFYDFTVDDFHFIVLDSKGQPDPQGYLPEDQLDWLNEKCKTSTARSLCIVTHHLPLKTQVPWFDRDMRIMNDDALFKVLKPYRDKIRGLFFGHIHHAFTGFRDGIMCSTAPSSFRQFYASPDHETPVFDMYTAGGFSLVTLTHKSTIISHRHLPADYQNRA